MDEPMRILHIVGAMYPGGMENFIMNLYEKIDRDRFQFDFVVHLRKENDYVDQIEKMGGRVYLLPRLTKNPVQNLTHLYQLIQSNNYRIVIRHTANALIAPQLLTAKLAGAKTVCHSHSEQDSMKILHFVGRLLMKAGVDKRLACSERAGIWMYGKRDFTIIHNAIDLSKYMYNQQKAEKIKKEFQIQDKHIYGHIGNLVEVKNHLFLLEVFRKISEKDDKAVLFFVGEGELRDRIEEKIEELKLKDKVILTGVRYDVDYIMSAIEVIIFPSIFEGLPLTLIEAQIAGIPMVISDSIAKEVEVTEGLVYRNSLQDKEIQWAKTAMDIREQKKNRDCQKELIQKAGYDIEQLVEWYSGFLQDLLEKSTKRKINGKA